MKEIDIKYYHSFSEIATIWQRFSQVEPPSYFCTLAWHKIVREFLKATFLTKKVYRLVYFTVSDTETDSTIKLLGFFFIKSTKGTKSINFTQLLGPSDYYDFVYVEPVSSALLKNIITKIASDQHCTAISFSHIKESSKLFEVLKQFDSLQFESLDCVALELNTSYDEHHQSLSKNSRQNLRTAHNRIIKNGVRSEIVFLKQQDATAIDFKLLKNIYKERSSSKNQFVHWKSKLYNLMDDPFRKKLDLFDLKEVKETDFILGILKLDNEIGAYFFGLSNGSTVEINRVALNQKLKFYSPGMVLLDTFVKLAYETGILTIDLTVGDEKYKYDLGGITHKIYNIKGIL
jgi:hypothetical protein